MALTKITLERPDVGVLSTSVALHMPALAQSIASIHPERANEVCHAAFNLAMFGTVEVESPDAIRVVTAVVRLSELLPRSRFFMRVASDAGEHLVYDIARGGCARTLLQATA